MGSLEFILCFLFCELCLLGSFFFFAITTIKYACEYEQSQCLRNFRNRNVSLRFGLCKHTVYTHGTTERLMNDYVWVFRQCFPVFPREHIDRLIGEKNKTKQNNCNHSSLGHTLKIFGALNRYRDCQCVPHVPRYSMKFWQDLCFVLKSCFNTSPDRQNSALCEPQQSLKYYSVINSPRQHFINNNNVFQ